MGTTFSLSMARGLGALLWLASIFFVTQITAPVWLAASGCFFAIAARIYQSDIQHRELMAALSAQKGQTT